MKKFFTITTLIFSFSGALLSKEEEKKIIYEYKKYEKFDFDDMAIEGGEPSPGAISISPRKENEFVNKIPDKKNFNREILNSLESIK